MVSLFQDPSPLRFASFQLDLEDRVGAEDDGMDTWRLEVFVISKR